MEPFRISGHDLSEVAPQGPTSAPLSTEKISRGKFDWPRLHPYTSALIGGGVLIVVGIGIVSWRSAVEPSGGAISAWGGANINLLNPAYNAPQNNAGQGQSQILQQAQNTASYVYIPPARQGDADSSASGGGSSFDFNAFISTLSRDASSTQKITTGNGTLLQSSYSFIPTGLVSISSQTKKRSNEQQQLYNYGNEVGTYIQSFEEAHNDQAQVLKNWLEDRKDAAKVRTVVELGRALWETGRGLSSMESVPTAARATHDALAKSFMDIGANLALVPKTESDADLLKAIGVYNASADIYAKNYVALVNIFGAYGVGFSSDDPGSVFTFTAVSL